VDHHVRDVAQLPAGRREIRREQLLLAAEPEPGVEPAAAEERLPPYHRRPGQEAAERRTR
jgi:hypothetical protein